MAQFTTLYSGSSGNSTLIRTNGATVLVDMGQSCKKTLTALYSLGVGARDIDAVLITHEHSDHVSGLRTFLKHYPVRLYGPARSLACLRGSDVIPRSCRVCEVDGGGEIAVGDLSFRAFGTSHDSEACVGYRFDFGGGKSAAVATDLGFVSDAVLDALKGCALVGLEANYDENMLLCGPYPYYLKSRIRSNLGHLSNDDCARTAALLAQSGTDTVVLMHLSRENNLPELAGMACSSALENCGCPQCRIVISPRFEVGETIEI